MNMPSGVDPDIQDIMGLRSPDRERTLAVLRRKSDLRAVLMPHVIPLLAWNAVAETRSRIAVVARPNTSARSPMPCSTRTRTSQSGDGFRALSPSAIPSLAADCLFQGLEDTRFEVRFQCGRALATMVAGRRHPYRRRSCVRVVRRRSPSAGRYGKDGICSIDSPTAKRDVCRRVHQKPREPEPRPRVYGSIAGVAGRAAQDRPARAVCRRSKLHGTALEYLERILPPPRSRPALALSRGHRPAARTLPPAGGHRRRLAPSDQFITLNLEELNKRPTPRSSTMAEHKHLIAPREPTPVTGRPPTTQVPDTCRRISFNEQVQRLALFSLIERLWTGGLAMDQLVRLTVPSCTRPMPGRHRIVEVLGILVSR